MLTFKDFPLLTFLVDQGQKVWWIFDRTRREIESPNLLVEVWVKPQEVLEHTLSVSVCHDEGLCALDMAMCAVMVIR